jgi:hypothetical protein
VVRPDFNQAIGIDFQGAQITSDTGFLLLREIDDRFKIIAPMEECLEEAAVLVNVMPIPVPSQTLLHGGRVLKAVTLHKRHWAV